MSQNNTINKSDKKFIRREKARIRSQFLDVKKQQELIDNLYKKFLVAPEAKVVEVAKEVRALKVAKEPKKEKPKAKKIKK